MMMVGGEKHAKRVGLEAEIAGQQNDSASVNIQKLILLLIDDAREENDTALVKGVIRNQGKISGLQSLYEIITRDQLAFTVPQHKKA